MAAFAQLVAVRHGSNKCVHITAIFTKCQSTKQHICIKFCFKTGKTATETYQLLQQAYGEDAMGHTQVFDWVRQFKEGRTSVESDSRSGRLSTSKNEEMWASYTTSTLPMGKQLTRNSTWRSCYVCVDQFDETDQKNGEMATGSCTTTMRPLTLHTLCSSFWSNMAPLSCSSRHTHQISHCVTFSYSQVLRKF